VPGDAGVAKQQGKYVAKLLIARSKSKTFPPFRYRDLGSIAAIGRKSAIVQMHWLKLTGLLGWLVWSVAHIYYLIGFRNRTIVAMNWVWNYLTLQRGARLITGVTGARIEDMAQCVPSPAAAKADGADHAALPYAAPTLEHSNHQAPQSGQVDGPTDQAALERPRQNDNLPDVRP
jgi:NADH:ubiquinone reductase (H+-translocating)